jgi:lipopolysaccharide/colanic/teichoic acid biosynthesis glycosyltransferase
MQLGELSTSIEKRLKSHYVGLIIKRVLDVILSVALFVLLLPVLLIIAAAIKLDTSGPVIFKQKRIGINSRYFTIYKFRTMVKDAEGQLKLNINRDNIGSLVFQDKGDKRITRVGSFLRKTSLDELPQLANVFIGNMSFVGPRPEIKDVADYYNDIQKLRLKVKPGITGLAQVSGRGEIDLDRTIQYDLEYILKFSLCNDFKILLKTVTTVIGKKGAF